MTVITLKENAINSFFPVSGNKINVKHNNFSGNDYADSDSFTSSNSSNAIVKKRIAQKIADQADEFARNERSKEAEENYLEAIKQKEDFAPSYYGLAKIYKNADKNRQAIETYEKLLKVCPDEHEAHTLMGLCYKKAGDFDKARECFQSVCNKDPKYDFAARSLKEIDNLILAKSNPKLAEQQKEEQSQENLKNALVLIKANTSPKITDRLKDVDYAFDKTDSLSGHANIAQYEDSKRRIVVTEDYRWAAPEIIAAYLAHEDIHASDKDGYTSVYEEQDAYEESMKFWIKNNNGIKDPELDYATDLYNKSPQTLRNKVAEIYKSRDSKIADTSPNHPPNAAVRLSFWDSIRSAGKRLSAAFGLS